MQNPSMQKPALEDPARTRPIVQHTYQRGKKKGQPIIEEDGRTFWSIQDEFHKVVGVFDGNVPPKAHLYTDTQYHPHVYITGRVGEAAKIPSRECEILSAHSLGKDAEAGGRLLILGDEPLSRASANFKYNWEWPLILIVPEPQRASVFNHIIDAERSLRLPGWHEEVNDQVQALGEMMKECGVSSYRIFSAGRCVGTSPD